MAFPTLPRYVATFTFVDSAERNTSVSVNVSKADADAWNDAANQGARDLTDIGVFSLALQAMTLCNLVSVSIASVLSDTAPIVPASGLRGNKAVFTAVSGLGTKQQTSIPAYAIALLPVEDDNITIDVNAVTPTEYADYKTAFLAIALTNEGNAITGFVAGKLND